MFRIRHFRSCDFRSHGQHLVNEAVRHAGRKACYQPRSRSVANVRVFPTAAPQTRPTSGIAVVAGRLVVAVDGQRSGEVAPRLGCSGPGAGRTFESAKTFNDGASDVSDAFRKVRRVLAEHLVGVDNAA